MKKYVLVIIVVLVASFTACAVKASTNPSDPQTEVSITSEETRESETETSKKESVKETTQKTSKKQKNSSSKKTATETEQSTKSRTTTKEATATKKQQPTTQKPTEKKTTTTKNQQTTKAPVTKPQTTKPKTCTKNYNHNISCGNMGRWFSSRSEVRAYVNAEMNKWNSLYESGAIGEDEYFRNCPSGYECWSCSNCGSWTGNFTY